MALTPGLSLGPYRIEAPIGAGGMGEVYRARDTRLDRIVAIKVLASQVADDPELQARFDREARTISSLDHPHICTLFDVGHDASARIDYIVMQHLEGETLAGRLSTGAAIPIDEALRFAIQIASALDAAHRAGIVHRDLKPGNVMITKSGVKLLDFGLAKMHGPRSPAGLGSIAITQSSPITERGTLLGTLQYMSPEQLEGGEADPRSDIFSFGAMLFEILTGRRAFEGQSQAGVIAAILNAEPPPLGALADAKAGLQVDVRRALDRLLRKCLAKNPDARWQSAADLADELRWIDEERGREQGAPGGTSSRPRIRERLWMGAAAVAWVVIAGLAAWAFLRPAAPPVQPITLGFDAPNQNPFADVPALLAMSPDGRRVAFLAGAGTRRLWVRSLDSSSAQLLPGTEQANQPSWSPDSRFVLFSVGPAGGELKKIDITTGQATAIAEFAVGRSSWSRAGIILFHGRGGQLMRVGDGGGEATVATTLDPTKNERAHDWPFFLPDGRRFLFVARTSGQDAALYLGSVDSPARTLLFPTRSNVDYANGFILYDDEGTLMAQPFDEQREKKTGAAIAVVGNLAFNPDSGRAAFSTSTNGVLAYRAGVNNRIFDLAWYDRAGQFLRTTGETAEYFAPSISPDGQRLAVGRRDKTGHLDVWIMDLDRDVSMKFTSDPNDDSDPVWSQDGRQVFFASNRHGAKDLYVKQGGGATPEELLYASTDNKTPTGVSSDGRFLLFNRDSSARRRDAEADVWALPLSGERKPFLVVAAPSNDAVFSPDGHLIAYESRESGDFKVYVQPYPATGDRIQLSTKGGQKPMWTADSRRVIYGTGGRRLMSVGVSLSGGTLKAERPVALPIPAGGGPFASLFTMTASGDRFLTPKFPDEDSKTPITITLNWMTGLKK